MDGGDSDDDGGVPSDALFVVVVEARPLLIASSIATLDISTANATRSLFSPTHVVDGVSAVEDNGCECGNCGGCCCIDGGFIADVGKRAIVIER